MAIIQLIVLLGCLEGFVQCGLIPDTFKALKDVLFQGEIDIKLENDNGVVKTKLESVGPIPASWDWREKGLMTTDLNQHIPQYCGR